MFSVNGVPVFRCHECGGGEDPITFFARTAKISLDEAAEIIQSEKGFFGEDITPFLRKVKFVHEIMDLHNLRADDYRADLDEARALSFIQDGNDSYMRDRSRLSVTELHERIPSLKSSISAGRGKVRKVLMQVYRNHAAAPGKLQILSEEGELLREIILDDQNASSHFYVSAPRGMLDRPWDENVIIFPSETIAESLWDWVLEWGNEERDAAIMAVHSIKGDFRKVNSKRVTVIPVGVEPAWAGSVYSAGDFSDVRVFRLDPQPRLSSARETFYPLRDIDQWSRLPSVAEDFVSTTIRMFESKNPQAIRALLDGAITKSYLSKEGELAIIERLKQSLPLSGQLEIDRMLDEITVSIPYNIESNSYIVGSDSYVREDRGRQTVITNFRTKILARVKQARLSNPGRSRESIYVLKTKIVGFDDPVISMVKERDFYRSTSLMSAIRESCYRQGAPFPIVNVSTDERRLSKIIEGTQGSIPELIDFPHLGFDRATFSFHFPGLRISKGEDFARPICTSGLSELITGGSMPHFSEGSDNAIAALLSSEGPVRDAILKALGFSVWFLFRASRAPRSFHAFIRDERFARLVSKVSGMKILDERWFGDCISPIEMGEVPCLTLNVQPAWAARLFKRSVFVGVESPSDRRFLCETTIPELDDQVLGALPGGNFRSLIKAIISANNMEEVSDFLYVGGISSDTRRLVQECVIRAAEGYLGDLDRFLEFLRQPEGEEFLERSGDRVMISSSAVDRAFAGSVSTSHILDQLRVRARGDVKSVSRRPRRTIAWDVPVSVLTGEDRLIQFNA